MEAKHTPGRWSAAARPSSIVGWPVVAAPLGRSICSVSFIFAAPGQPLTAEEEAFNRESAANARLISASPALLEALKGLEPYLDAIVCYASTMDEHEPNRLAAQAIVAIRQAEGGE